MQRRAEFERIIRAKGAPKGEERKAERKRRDAQKDPTRPRVEGGGFDGLIALNPAFNPAKGGSHANLDLFLYSCGTKVKK